MLSSKPWNLEAVLFLFAGVLSCLFFAMLATYGFNAVLPDLALADRRFYEFLIGTVGLQMLPLVLVHGFLKRQEITWAGFLGFGVPQVGRAMSRAAAVALLTVPVALALNEISNLIITAIQSRPAEMQPSMQVLEISYTPFRRVLFSFAAIVMAPIMEEIIFRGVLYSVIKESGYPRLALWATAFVFAAIHGSRMTMVPLMFVAIVLTLLYERTGKLLAPIVAHAGFNAANILIYFLSRDVHSVGPP